jgi:hypothetical protein
VKYGRNSNVIGDKAKCLRFETHDLMQFSILKRWNQYCCPRVGLIITRQQLGVR